MVQVLKIVKPGLISLIRLMYLCSMKITFSKYQGTGNDFIMLDNMNGHYEGLTIAQIQQLCDRKLGVGADGLIKLTKTEGFDFEVEYFNADGSQSFCGNGARCSVVFARALGLIDNEAHFLAIDGAHKATVENDIVRLEMLPVTRIEKRDENYLLDTGSPHFVRFVVAGEKIDIVEYGKEVRYSEEFKDKGVNVNVVEVISPSEIVVQTYERGVEDETLSCGTGVTACALVQMGSMKDNGKVTVQTKGGTLSVEANANGQGFDQIWLSGPAKKVFDGSIEL